jgi:CheY-like chemotaxis protein
MRSSSGMILLIQHSLDETRLLLDAFRGQRHSCLVEILPDGEECLAYLAGEGKYQNRARYPVASAIVCDLDLPGLSGFDLLTRLRERPEFVTIPVFVVTSSRQPRDIQRAFALGARSYLIKPVALGGLRLLVRAITCDGDPERGPGSSQAKVSAEGPEAKAGQAADDGLKRFVVGSSS